VGVNGPNGPQGPTGPAGTGTAGTNGPTGATFQNIYGATGPTASTIVISTSNTAHIWLVPAGSTITLPAGAPAGTFFELRGTGTGTPTFTIKVTSGLIYAPVTANSGVTSFSQTSVYYLEVFTDGTNWWLLN
jgi:hypothetical protein